MSGTSGESMSVGLSVSDIADLHEATMRGLKGHERHCVAAAVAACTIARDEAARVLVDVEEGTRDGGVPAYMYVYVCMHACMSVLACLCACLASRMHVCGMYAVAYLVLSLLRSCWCASLSSCGLR